MLKKRALLVFGIALGFRCLVSAPALIQPERSHGLDTGAYIALADNLFRGRGFSWDTQPPFSPNLVRTPVYPVFLAIFYSPFGNERPALVAQILLGALLALVVFFLGERISGNGLAGGLLAALDPFTALFGAMLYTELLFGLFLTVGVLLLFKRKNILAGLVMGASCLVRPGGLVLALAGVFPALRRDWRGLWDFGWGFCLLPVLWVARNFLVSGHLLFTTIADVNLGVFVGPMARAEALGTSYRDAWEGSDPHLRRTYESDPLRAANDPGFAARARARGLEDILRYPGDFAFSFAKGIAKGLAGLDFHLPSSVLAHAPSSTGSLTAGIGRLFHGDPRGFILGLKERLSGTPAPAMAYTLYSWLFLLLLYIAVIRSADASPERITCLLVAGALVVVAGPLASFRFRTPAHGLLEGTLRGPGLRPGPRLR